MTSTNVLFEEHNDSQMENVFLPVISQVETFFSCFFYKKLFLSRKKKWPGRASVPCFTFKLARPFITGEAALNVGSGPIKPTVPEASHLLRFHLRPVVVTLSQGFPMGMRPHQEPSSPVSTCSLCLPCKTEMFLESVLARCHQTAFDGRPCKQTRRYLETGPECPPRAQEYLVAAGSQATDVYRGRRDVC